MTTPRWEPERIPHLYSTFDREVLDLEGWAIHHIGTVPGDRVNRIPYSYTIGLTALGRPELMITGLPSRITHDLLIHLAGDVADRERRFTDGERIHVRPGTDGTPGELRLRDGIADWQQRPRGAEDHYGAGNVRLQQLVWPDAGGLFPGEPGCLLSPADQPLLTRPDDEVSPAAEPLLWITDAAVVELPRPDLTGEPACMPAGTPPWRRLARQVVPRRGPLACCWYHGTDWAAVSRAAIGALASSDAGLIHRDPSENLEEGRKSAARVALRAQGLDAATLRAAESLFEAPIQPTMLGSDPPYLDGRRRAQAMLDAGVRRTVVGRWITPLPSTLGSPRGR